MAFLLPAAVPAFVAVAEGAAVAGMAAAPAAMVAATGTAVGAGATGLTSFIAPTLSVLGTAGQLFSGMSERLSVAAQRRAEADLLERQARQAGRQELRQGMKTASQAENIAGGSGLDISSGTPLSIMIDNVATAHRNAQQTYREGMMQASLRRREASEADNPWALIGYGSSILSDFVKRRYA